MQCSSSASYDDDHIFVSKNYSQTLQSDHHNTVSLASIKKLTLFGTTLDRGVTLYCSLPVLSIKWNDVYAVDSTWIKTSVVDAPPIRIGARSVEALHTTLRTECVFGLVSVECVASQMLPSLKMWGKKATSAHNFNFSWWSYLKEFEVVFRHNEVLILFYVAYATAACNIKTNACQQRWSRICSTKDR